MMALGSVKSQSRTVLRCGILIVGALTLMGQGVTREAVQAVLTEEMRRTCREANNGCQVCVILAPSGIVHCSLPGIACQPKAWTCRYPVVPAPELRGDK